MRPAASVFEPASVNSYQLLDLTKLQDSFVRVPTVATSGSIFYTLRESFSRYVIVTDATSITVRSLTDLVSFSGGYNSTGLLVNGTPQGTGNQLGAQGTLGDQVYSLPAGTNTLELIDGPSGLNAVGTPPIRATPNIGYRLAGATFATVQSPTAPAVRALYRADSISNGAFVDAGTNQASVYQADTILMRANMLASSSGTLAGARLIMAGTGGRQWADIIGTATSISDELALMGKWLNGTTSNTAMWCLGVNDTSSVATLTTNLTTFMNAVAVAFPSLNRVIITPLLTGHEATPNAGGATPPQIRTAISGVATALSIPQIDGTTLLAFNGTNFAADNLHLRTAGMITLEANRRAALVSLGIGY